MLPNAIANVNNSASYRSLLDTAETIIDMETCMEQVEGKLARVGHNCNTRMLDRISNSAVRLDSYIRSRGKTFLPPVLNTCANPDRSGPLYVRFAARRSPELAHCHDAFNEK